jgi:ATP-binding cassette subfamily B protein
MRDSSVGDGRLSLVRLRWALFREVMRVGPVAVTLLVVATVLPGLLRGAMTVFTGVIVGAVPAAVAGGLGSPGGRRAVVGLVVVGCVFALQTSMAPLRGALTDMLGRRIEGDLQARVMGAVLRPPGVAHLERADVADRIALAQSVGIGEVRPRAALSAAVSKYGTQLYGLVSVVLLLGFAWWAPLLVGGAWLFLRRAFARRMRGAVQVTALKTRSLRRSGYYRDLALTATAAKETRVFGLDSWLLDRFLYEWADAMREVWRSRRQSGPLLWLSLTALVAAHLLVYGLIASQVVHGQISLGAMVVYLMAVTGVRDIAESESDDRLDKGSRSILAAVELDREMSTPEFRLAGEGAAAGLPRDRIRFENVRFRYPDTHRDVFTDLTLDIPHGRSLAIVGQNGAGKTTLVKLLARLYDPTGGRITVDGRDLRDLDPAAWSRQVAAIFQDFVRYQLTAADNVGFGALHRAADRQALTEAVRQAGATEVLDALPDGWETVLSREFSNGTDLSGGQWQRVALARALFAAQAGAGVLVLDEPTAQLDARGEAEFFERFLEMTRGHTTVIISHRFSTVRKADSIVVLEHGRVVEQGRHDDLVAANGRYARMFAVQAARFADDPEPARSTDA